MVIKSFFKKIGNGFKKAGRFIKDKVFPVVGRLAKPVFGMLSWLPWMIWNVGRIGNAVTNTLTGITNQIPNEKARDKIQGVINNVNDKFQGAVQTGQNFANNANNIVDKVKNDPNIQRLQEHFKKKYPVDIAGKISPK